MPITVTSFQLLACPLDGEPLQPHEKTWKCSNGHSFDVARQGYIHLLPVQNKHSRDPGDSKEMIAARQRFLNSNVYHPIAKAVNHAILDGTSPTMNLACLDAGSGEGYYLRQLATAKDSERHLQLLGVDISKWAVLSAAKQDPGPCWIVGSNAKLPVQSSSLDRVLCMFGFPVYPEFARVLKTDGKLIQVDAGPKHLIELREIIYPSLKSKSKLESTTPENYILLSSEPLSFSISLTDAEQISDLLLMTPHLYRINKEGREKAAAITALDLTIDVQLKTYQKIC